MSRRLTSVEELLEATHGHPFVRWAVGSSFTGEGYAVGPPGHEAVAFTRLSPRRVPGLTVMGEPAGLAALLDDPDVSAWVRTLVTDGVEQVNVPAGHLDVVAAGLALGEGHDWEWMWTTSEPECSAAEDALVGLAPVDLPELGAVLAEHNPDTMGQPFARPGQIWVGVREAGRLVAVGGLETSAAGTPYVSGVTVEPTERGRGLARAITARLTRLALSTHGVCTLGIYSHNDRARSIYLRMGFETAACWQTRRILRGPLPP